MVGPRINSVITMQIPSSGKYFEAFEIVGRKRNDKYLESIRHWKGLTDYFGIVLFPKNVLNDEIHGDYVIDKPKNFYTIIGLLSSDKFRRELLDRNRLVLLEEVVYVPRDKIEGLVW